MPTTSSHSPQVVRVVFPAGAGRPGPNAFIVASYWREMGADMADAVCYMWDSAVAVREMIRENHAHPDEVRIFRSSYQRFVAVDQLGKVLQDNEAEADLLG